MEENTYGPWADKPFAPESQRLYGALRDMGPAYYLCFTCKDLNEKEYIKLQEELEAKFPQRLNEEKSKWTEWLRGAPTIDDEPLLDDRVPTFSDLAEAKSHRHDRFMVTMNLSSVAEAAALECSLKSEFWDYGSYPPHHKFPLSGYIGERLPDTYQGILRTGHKPEPRVDPYTGVWQTYDGYLMVWRGSIYRDKDDRTIFFWLYDRGLSRTD